MPLRPLCKEVEATDWRALEISFTHALLNSLSVTTVKEEEGGCDAIEKETLALRVRILQDTCQAASCDALAQNDANMQLDYEGLCA